ncbi:MAG: APC family permease [Planctomycetes bacterium]|nr:APC family permease [Planctomycetota bacterium]
MPVEPNISQKSQSLQRRIGLAGATAFGLGAILGTGVFVTVVTATQQHGATVLIGIALAALAAVCNGLSSAQLAAAFPVSGGTYEYAYRVLNPWLGFTAGWLFLCAKCASAAAATLGAASYVQLWLPHTAQIPAVLIAVMILFCVGLITLSGIRWANGFNLVLVVVSLSSLAFFVGEVALSQERHEVQVVPSSSLSVWGTLQAAAIMFVAFTGYGRIATLGEEVQAPRRTIPRAVIVTLILTAGVYLCVALATLRLLSISDSAEPPQNLLELASPHVSHLAIVWLTVGALAAMLAVENNLILGLSRVVLAMGRRGDLPARLAQLNQQNTSPTAALILVVMSIGLVILISDFKIAWEFSALTVLVYYGITNVCALRLDKSQRLFPPWVSILGVMLTFGLAVFIQPKVWGVAAVLLLLGWCVRVLFQNTRFPGNSV